MWQRLLESAVMGVPVGRWAVAVSGGADSVALLSLLRQRPDLSLHVVHLNHQTRGRDSAEDAEFVRRLADQWGLSITIGLREQVERKMPTLATNRSARYRAARVTLFRMVVNEQALDGVILAHHADDQAETVLHRLIRGSGPNGLAGMSPKAAINGLTILRPLLGIRRAELRNYLNISGQPWREDASNQSDQYLRNRLRSWLSNRGEMHEALLDLGSACRTLRNWVRATAPELEAEFAIRKLADLPQVLARESARRWLSARGVPPAELTESVLDRLVDMAGDAASAPRQAFPGDVCVRRRSGLMFCDQG